MIIDVHCHLGKSEYLKPDIKEEEKRIAGGKEPHYASDEEVAETIRAQVDRAILLPFHWSQLGVRVSNERAAEFVQKYSDTFIGFLSVDPHLPEAYEDLKKGFFELGLKGVKMSAIYQNFDPLDDRMKPIYAFAEKHGLPMMLHQATVPFRRSLLKYASPALFDEVALEFPNLKMIMAHMGHPWVEDCIVMVRKHPHVYADVSGVLLRPWMAYNFLRLATEWGILDKLLFGSDYPFVMTPQETIDRLRGINDILEGTKLPPVPEDAIEEIIHRDSLAMLGLE